MFIKELFFVINLDKYREDYNLLKFRMQILNKYMVFFLS